MIRRAALALLACGCRGAVPRPPCPAGDVVIAAQDQVAALAPCTAIHGTLQIRSGAPLDLRPLAGLGAIDGDLRIGPTLGLGDLDGFGGLRAIGGTLRIAANAEATGAWFPVLASVGRLEIAGNPALAGFYAPALARIPALVVRDNGALELVALPADAAIGAVDIAHDPAWPAEARPIARP